MTTAAELIAILQKLPADAPILVLSDQLSAPGFWTAGAETIFVKDGSDGEWASAEVDEEGAIAALNVYPF